MIDVITLTFNNYSELLSTLNSISHSAICQSIVINGGDCPETKDFLKENTKSVSISEKDNGIADAFNKGLQLAKDDKIMFLNSGDILISKDYLEWAEEFLNAHSEYDFVFAQIEFLDPIAGPIILGQHQVSIGSGMPYPHPTMIARKALFEKIGNFNTSYRVAMDYDWAVRIFKHGSKGYFYSKPVIRMDGTGVSTKQELKSILESLRAIRENGLFNLENFLHWTSRFLRYQMRNFLPKKLVVFLKRQLSNNRLQV